MSVPASRVPAARTFRRRLVSVLCALALLPLAALAAPSPASAATSQFRGMNWAVTGDNFSTGPLVIDVYPRLTTSYAGLRPGLGINAAEMVLSTLRGNELGVAALLPGHPFIVEPTVRREQSQTAERYLH